MKNGLEELAKSLLSTIYTTTELKRVSVILENLSQSPAFKSNAYEIASDPNLSDIIKKNQLLFLFKDIDVPLIYTFFSNMFGRNEFWMFDSKQFDYFDEFVQAFQLQTEKIIIINLETAIELMPPDLIKMADNLSKSLETHVVIHQQVNPSIIGGALVRVGNLIFDYSLRSKFRQFQRQWLSSISRTSQMVGRE